MAIQAHFPLFGSLEWESYGCGGAVETVSNTGVGGVSDAFSLTYQLQHLQWQQQQNLNGSFPHMNASRCYSSNHIPFRSMAFASYEEKQAQEIDKYVTTQQEKLRLLLQEQSKQQMAMLMRRFESKALPLLKQKDDEIAKANSRTMELEYFLKKLEAESWEWQRVAQESEAMVVSLNNTIEHLREKGSSCSSNSVNDATSCCDANRPESKGDQRMVCNGCKLRKSCILFLPCRHLSSCKTCETVLDSCPVCKTTKRASIEALMG